MPNATASDKKTILAINPGSTSTKIAVYENEAERFKVNIEHPREELAKYPNIAAQYDMRKDAVVAALASAGVVPQSLTAIACRGAVLPPLQSGAYRVNAAMVDLLLHRPMAEHASNVAALIGYELAQQLGIEAYIYDGVCVDELTPLARLSGLPDMPRRALSHALNMRAQAHRAAARLGRAYEDVTLIIAHLGGGITSSIHVGGKMVDIVSDDEGPYSPERPGRLPCIQLAEYCVAKRPTLLEVRKLQRGGGGLVAYLGTASAKEVEERAAAGDAEAELIYRGMAYQIAKSIGELATVTNGAVDAIVLTGGIAYSKMLTGWIEERVKFIAPVLVLPGENELEALAHGVLRVLRQEEAPHEFTL